MAPGLKNFIVTAYENHAPQATNSESQIPNSTCDNGSCSEITAALWENTLTYGFGYRCDNIHENNCAYDFFQNQYYKQFSDESKQKTPQIIMSGYESNTNQEIQMTYKLNISKNQSKGSYSNSITFIASPGY